MAKALPLVSVVIPTKNSESTIMECVKSIRNQSYSSIEVIIVDNYSTDLTAKIAVNLGSSLYLKGPERSAQRNFGASKARGEYIFFLDSDLIAPQNLVKDCVQLSRRGHADAILISYISFGNGYWTRCRCVESLFYQNEQFSIPRFFRREAFRLAGGFDIALNAGEDIELYLRLINLGFKVVPSAYRITHLEKRVSLSDLLRKDVRAIPYVSKYLRKRKTYNVRFSGARFPIVFISKIHLVKSNPKYLPGLLLLKVIDYLTVFLSWAMN